MVERTPARMGSMPERGAVGVVLEEFDQIGLAGDLAQCQPAWSSIRGLQIVIGTIVRIDRPFVNAYRHRYRDIRDN